MVDAGRTIILIKGEYDATETYEFLDVVYLASTGNSYICKVQSSTGNAPDEAGSQYWQIFCRGTIVDSVLDSTSQNPVANAAITGALNDKVDASGGDTADTVVSNFVSSQETLPVPSAGDNVATLWGTVAKFMSDARNLFIRATGDVAQTVVSTFTTQSTKYPTPTAGETQSTLWGKVAKYLADLKGNYCAKADLVNGFTQQAAGRYALDAAAGKSLNDALANMTAGIDTTGHGTVAAQSSITINGFRNGLLFTYRNNTNNGIFAIYGGGSVFTLAQSSNPTMSVTASDNNVTLTNSSGAQAWYIFFRWTS